MILVYVWMNCFISFHHPNFMTSIVISILIPADTWRNDNVTSAIFLQASSNNNESVSEFRLVETNHLCPSPRWKWKMAGQKLLMCSFPQQPPEVKHYLLLFKIPLGKYIAVVQSFSRAGNFLRTWITVPSDDLKLFIIIKMMSPIQLWYFQ